MVPEHARARRHSTMRYYRRKRFELAVRRARRVVGAVNASRGRIVAGVLSFVVLLLSVGFIVGLVVARRFG